MQPSLDHPRHEQLTAFLWGHLKPGERAEIEEHIAACATCCQALREIPDDTLMMRLRGKAETGTGQRKVKSSAAPSLPRELRHHPRYRVSRFLGAGGMGRVYQAEHRLMQRHVALKIIHPDLIGHPLALACFREEVRAAARLAHPNIVTAFDAEREGELHFLVMEYVDGISLGRLVAKRGPLDVTHACHYTRQAAQGLQHAFESGMVHRDIKPHNLMLTRKGRVKILDFGLARLVSETDGTPAAILGTPDFMAPEQAVNARRVDIRADIYSLGSTLYYLLSGQTPFANRPPVAKLLLRGQPRPVGELCKNLPRGLTAIMDRMLAHDATDRYQTPAEVIRDLTPFAKAVPTEEREPERAAPVVTRVPSGRGSRDFLSRCRYCPTTIRLPETALAASVPCPRCRNYFTAVPEDRFIVSRSQHPASANR